MAVEIVLLSAALVATLAVVRGALPERSRWFWGITYVAVQSSVLLLLIRTTPADSKRAPEGPKPSEAYGYVSSEACRACHPAQFESWHRSFHRTMTQVADQQSVKAPFNSETIEVRGASVLLFRKGDEYWARLPDPDYQATLAAQGRIEAVPQVERRVVMTTGSHHYQAYWVQGRGGTLRQLPVVYSLEQGRFLVREHAFLQPEDAKPYAARWNSNCVQCHAVAGRPEHDPDRDVFDTRVAELGIACEACHGPAREHVRRLQNPLLRYQVHFRADAKEKPGSAFGLTPPQARPWQRELAIVNPARLSAARSADVCGQCHAYFVPQDEGAWWETGYVRAYRPGQALSESRHVLDYASERDRRLISADFESVFWNDGTIRVGGREYNGLIKSPCFEHGRGARQLTCTSCHSLHRSDPVDQLGAGMDGDRACTQCHSQFTADLSAHTRHPASSSGSRCYNCHMPHTTYALFKGIRSHRVTSPSVVRAQTTGRPNACNLCHLDKTSAWAARHLSEWYGHPVPSLGEHESNVAAAVLGVLSGDAAVRAIYAFHLGRADGVAAAGADFQVPILAPLLEDPYPAVRFVAARSLRSFPGFASLKYDFEASPAARRAARTWVSKQWRKRRQLTPRNSKARAMLLQTPAGESDARRIAELIANRDDRPIMIAE